MMASLDLLINNTIKTTADTITAVGGQEIKLIKKGTARIETHEGPLVLNNTYYAKGLQYGLVNVLQLVKNGVVVYTSKEEAYIEKDNSRINLERNDGLWTLPTRHRHNVGALRMQHNNKADCKTWHARLGHISSNQMNDLVKQRLMPKNASGYDENCCEICNRTKPIRRQVPKTAEISGENTVQVDYMPVGHNKKGWKGEVGAYIYSQRKSKIVKAFTVQGAGTEEAAETLRSYIRDIVPYFKDRPTSVQTDAGSQFTTKQWRNVCSKAGLISRQCPVDHQAMNGQVERVMGTMASKIRAMLSDHSMPSKYWPLVLHAVTYILNRTPCSTIGGLTPFQFAMGRKADLSRARVFGCRAYVQIPKPQRRGKLSSTAWQGVMV